MAAAAVVALAACATSDRAGDAISYRAEDLRTGERVDLADHQGKAVLLSSWATWCAPCRKELPELDELYQSRKDEGLEVVAVNVDPPGASSKLVVPTVDELGLTMPTWKDGENRFATAFEGVAVPTNVLVDRDGRVAKVWNGALDLDDPAVRAEIDRVVR